MAEFIATTACNHPRLKEHDAVEKILAGYFVDPDLFLGVGFDNESGEPYLFMYGYAWPEAWKYPSDAKREDFYPYVEDIYEQGAEGFVQLLKDIAPHLVEPLTVHAVGATKCRFPLSATEWHVVPGRKKIEVTEFRHWQAPLAAAAPSQL